MSEALKPCPFCGAPGVWKAPWAVGCYVCNVHIPIEDWNRRAEVEHLKMELAGALDAEQTNARNAASYCVQLAAAKDQVVELEGEKKQLQQVVDLLYAREAYLMKGRDALQQQVDALQQRVHLCAGYDALVAENERLKGAAAVVDKMPPGVWEVWTSCSFRRISSDGKDGNVLRATKQSDGHPDLSWNEQQCQALCDLVNGIRAALTGREAG